MRTRPAFFAIFATLGLIIPPRTAQAEPPPDARSYAAQAERLVMAMDATSDHVRQLLRRARAQRATRGVGCLDEALSRVDVALRVGREEARAAREAAHDGDDVEAQRHLARVARLRDMSRSAAAMGQICAAGPEFLPYVEGTTVRVIVDPLIAPVAP